MTRRAAPDAPLATDPPRHTHRRRHEHDHGHDGGGPHGHGRGHDDHEHEDHEHEDHELDHHGRGGLAGRIRHFFVPHTHDVAASIDDALEASGRGIRAVKVSLVVLGLTAAAQLGIVAISGSVALLADTVHNFSDAFTAVPLWIAFVLGRRRPTVRFTHGFGRAEDLAALFIVLMIALSAVIAGVESVQRLADPQPLENLGWVLAAGVVGFFGNEAVAAYRIRVGRSIGSAALVADGVHARADGFTSLAVVLGAIGVWVGVPLADPLVGLLITAAILVLLWGTARDVGRRLMDGVDPVLTRRARHAVAHVVGSDDHTDLRLRWNGHRLWLDAELAMPAGTTLAQASAVTDEIEAALRQALPALGDVRIVLHPSGTAASRHEPWTPTPTESP